ncbi:MAG: hypothetical protein K0S76_1791 [Herbinix sp.]|jgi:competence protein ComEA|nr:hypothetical protein [Herbinix sp.]
MKKKFIITGFTILLFLVAGICYSCSFNKDKVPEVLIASLDNDGEQETTPQDLNENYDADHSALTNSEEVSADVIIYVHLCGAVVKPGVYEVNTGTRLIQVIELAGGLLKEAADDYINQAQPITDGQRIYIPTKDEVKELNAAEYMDGDKGDEEDSDSRTKLVNINKADAEELMNLPGIGQSKADSIIAYRNSNGNFSKSEDLMNIPGIKEGLFNQISSYITVN